MELEDKLKIYYITAILGVVFAVIGFSYNAWRLEATEANNNIRTAAFEVLTNLAELEQIIYAAHYDKDPDKGNPRTGWVKIGLIVDLGSLISIPVEDKARQLKTVWGDNWEAMVDDVGATDRLVTAIESVRTEIKSALISLN